MNGSTRPSSPDAQIAATTPGKDDSWVKFNVTPNRSPRGEYVFVNLETLPWHGRAEAHFQLSREDAFNLAAELSHAAEWLRRHDGKP